MKTFFVEIKIKGIAEEIKALIFEIQAKTKEDAIKTAQMLVNPETLLSYDY